MGYDHGDGRCTECDRTTQSDSNAFFYWYIMAAVIGFCYNELIGAIILIILGLIMMAK